eukprot:NODE_4_length_77007_cov_1.156642.p68 type:complete len:124 gc:universal NODE_4_length_77007_cov_1.156642:12740-13111(+)
MRSKYNESVFFLRKIFSSAGLRKFNLIHRVFIRLNNRLQSTLNFFTFSQFLFTFLDLLADFFEIRQFRPPFKKYLVISFYFVLGFSNSFHVCADINNRTSSIFFACFNKGTIITNTPILKAIV